MQRFHFILFVGAALASCAAPRNTHLQATRPGTQQRSGAIQLDLRTDKPVYRVGEPITVTLTASQRSRVEIWSEDAKGQRTPLWPRTGQRAALLAANQTLRLPPAGADWKVLAAEPRGTNTLVAVAKAETPPGGHASASHPAAPVFFHIGAGGGVKGKGERGLAVAPAPEPAAQPGRGGKATGEARWLYRVR